ncbi:MAG: aminotransferase class V-fold PLP-dependent enzyme, partial [Phycisphaeraceae bacterium]|nr:aminotransferase class V-fold PLP-dependent enzyme [Phycisphaeraceae bacterium]
MDFSDTHLRKTFPILNQLNYLNHAGMAPISGPAAEALTEYARYASENSALNSGWFGRIERIRADVARLIGARGPEEIAFIPNTSTGISMVARGLEWEPGDEVIISNVEYPANRYPWEDLQRLGVKMVEVAEQPDGRIPVESVIEKINTRTRVVSLSHVQYASGFQIDPRPIAEAVHKVGGLLCIDAIQSVGVMPWDVESSGIDVLAVHGYKWLMSPMGTGFFYCRADRLEQLHPVIVGWATVVDNLNYDDYRYQFQPTCARFEPGSPNIGGILGMGASISMLLDVGLEEIWKRIEANNAHAREGLLRQGWRIYSPVERETERSGIISFTPPQGSQVDSEAVFKNLREKQIEIALRAGRLRISSHFYNSTGQLDVLLDELASQLKPSRSIST